MICLNQTPHPNNRFRPKRVGLIPAPVGEGIIPANHYTVQKSCQCIGNHQRDIVLRCDGKSHSEKFRRKELPAELNVELAYKLCYEEIEEGGGLQTICKDSKVPSRIARNATSPRTSSTRTPLSALYSETSVSTFIAAIITGKFEISEEILIRE